MSEVKFTKNELRAQQRHLGQLEKYLPTLQLKKAMLQAEVNGARQEIDRKEREVREADDAVVRFAGLLKESLPFDLQASAEVVEVEKRYENIAGVEIPQFGGVAFRSVEYNLFNTPPWVDSACYLMRSRAELEVQVEILREKRDALAAELREVSIRVNLFEKVLIPRARSNIKKIRIFLGDQELAAVAQAKVAKAKILKRQEAKSL